MMADIPERVTLVPIARIEVLNSRDRNMKIGDLGETDGGRATAPRHHGAGSSNSRASLSSSITKRLVAKRESRDSFQRPTRSE